MGPDDTSEEMLAGGGSMRALCLAAWAQRLRAAGETTLAEGMLAVAMRNLHPAHVYHGKRWCWVSEALYPSTIYFQASPPDEWQVRLRGERFSDERKSTHHYYRTLVEAYLDLAKAAGECSCATRSGTPC